MNYLLIRDKVSDFATWKIAYERGCYAAHGSGP